MKNIFKTLAIIILFLSASYNTQAQNSPVQIGVVGIPPYPTHIGDFAAGTADHIKLQLLLTDLGATRTVWLRMKMSGPSLNIQTNENVYKPTYELVGGVPLTLGLADLAAFFNIDNISGTNSTQFAQPMAEGVYFICFEAFDNITNAPIGNNGCLSLLSTKNEPPMLTMPYNKAQVVEEIGSTQNAIFRWTPRHIGMGQYQYKFRIARVTDSSYTPPVWLSTFGPDYLINDVQGTMLQLNTGTYPLVAGGTYVWQVQVYGLSGTDTIDNFENGGNSEIWYFKYDQQSCTTPDVPWVTKASASTLLVHWECDGSSDYSIRYRSTNGDRWYYAEATDSPMLLTNLKPLTEYEIGVGLACSDKGYLYGSSISVSTLHDSDTTNKVNCGIGAGTNISNWGRVFGISQGGTFKATDFTVYVDSAVYNTTDTTFTGHGHLQIKHLYFANVKVKFEDIGVNSSGQLIHGKVHTTWDPAMGNILDMGAVTRGGTHAGDVVTGDCSAGITVDIDINSPDDIIIDKDHITTDADSNKTVDISIGSQTFTATKIPTSIVDPKGRYYGVDRYGNVKQVATTVTLPEASVKAITSKLDASTGTAAFSAITGQNEPNINTIYALDNWRTEYGQSVLWGAKYEDPNITGLKVGNKCMAPGVPDVLKVTLTLYNSTNPDKVKFITPKGVSFTYTRDRNDYTVNVLGGPKNDAQELYVTIDNGGGNYVSVGKLKLASYEPKTIKVAIVPVGSASIPPGIDAANLQTELNKIYNPVCINVKVRVAERFDDNSWDGGLKVEGSGLLSSLTSDMKNLNSVFSSKVKLKEGESCLFLVSKFLDGNNSELTNVDGDMPRGNKYGYLNLSNISSQNLSYWTRLTSHELSHGVFSLKHTFDNDYGFKPASNYLTTNLMNDGTGVTLTKFQWDCLHDPAIVIGAFEDDADAMSKDVSLVAYDTKEGKPFVNTAFVKTFVFYGSMIIFDNPGNNTPGISNVECKNGDITITFSDGKNKVYRALYDVKSNTFACFALSSDLIKATEKTVVKGETIYKSKNEYKNGILKQDYYTKAFNSKNEVLRKQIEYLSKRTDIDVTTANRFISALAKLSDAQVDKKITPKGGVFTGTGQCQFIDLSKTDSNNNYTNCWSYLIDDLENLIKASTDKITALMLKINETNISSTVETDIETKLNAFSETDYNYFTSDQSLKVLSYLVTYSMGSDYEWYALKIIKNTPKLQVRGLIEGLENNPITLNDPNRKPGYNGTLIYNLCKKIDGLAFDNFMNSIMAIYTLDEDLKNERLKKVVPEVIFVQNSYLFPENGEKFLNVDFTKDKKNLIIDQYHYAVDIDCRRYKDEFGVWGDVCNNKINKIKDESVPLKPFDLITIIEASDFTLMGDELVDQIVNPNIKIKAFPAIIAYYANIKGDGKNIRTYISNTLDVATLVIPGANIIKGAKWLSTAYKCVDIMTRVNAFTNLTINNTDLKDIPQIKEVLDAYNIITASLNVLQLGTSLSYALVKSFNRAVMVKEARKALDEAANAGNTYAKDILKVYEELSRYQKLKIYAQFVKGSGTIKTVEELNAVLYNINSSNTMNQLENWGIKAFFRGTTKTSANFFEGNANSIEHGVSTSIDPVRATIFAIYSASKNRGTKGTILIFVPNDLRNISLVGNNKIVREMEVIFELSPQKIAELSSIEITLENARKIVKNIYGKDLPTNIIDDGTLRLELDKCAFNSLEDFYKFVNEAKIYNIK